MKNFYLFEAGATKTDFLSYINGEKTETKLPGFNPNRDNGAFEIAVQEGVKLIDDVDVYFYGSGLESDKNKSIVREIFKFHEQSKLKVCDDILGAARAAFKMSPGIICIMGTGGLAAYYNGQRIVKRRGGYGFLVDDLGGGLELGKRVLAAWLNGDLEETTQMTLEEILGTSKDQIVAKIYQEKDLHFIASVTKFVPEMKDEAIISIVKKYFQDFFDQDVIPLTKEFNTNNFSIIGSLGTGFYSVIRTLSMSNNLELEQCIESPVQRLFDFHQKQS
ncbi:hypothetical protein K6119_03695 [Paracrocinitomix mangrovi]|uniref:hypothetical protein n=1 Tax=Paracrocinitomix mangrovi TaxID=2862509 RepID=UPI001C8E53A4|nr:hypothetical protein [Paracrocinitomix mangrovi]UKN02614.1 hypothetical protein K6119_03695 [Paracrocinitomix mangrovi]